MHDWEAERQPRVGRLRKPRELRIRDYPNSNLALRLTLGGVLVLLIGILCYDAAAEKLGWTASSLMSQVGDVIHPGRWLLSFAWKTSVTLFCFAMLGGISYTIYHLHIRSRQGVLVDVRRWPTFLFGLMICTVICSMRLGGFPNAISLIANYLAFYFGVWSTSTCFRGKRAFIWLIPKLASIAILLICLSTFALTQLLSDEPLTFEAPHVASHEKARLAKAVKTTEKLGNGVERLKLTERDINLMLATGFERFPLDGKADVQLTDGKVSMDLSLKLPRANPFGRYINVQGLSHLHVEDGNVAFQLERLQLGDLRIPKLILGTFGRWAIITINRDKHAHAAIQCIEQLSFSNGSVKAIFHRNALRGELKSAVQENFAESKAIRAATAAHLEYLVTSVDSLPRGKPQFVSISRAAFQFAQQRTLAGADPITENRAAILALGIMLGHYRVESLAGSINNPPLVAAARQYTGKVTLRGRQDWPRHFYVSAALAVLTNDLVSDGVGLLKEEIDSGKGGTGFSFPDLLADRAGTRFATVATQNSQSARRLQQLMADDISLDDIFPLARDLPEGIPAAQFEEEFGGIDGAKYNEICEEIDRRLATCRLLVNNDQ